MANNNKCNEWEIIRNPAFEGNLKSITTFPESLKRVNYQDKCIIQKNNEWINGEVHGFNPQYLYLFNQDDKIIVYKWNEVKFIKKKIPQALEVPLYTETEERTDFVAVIFAVVIFIATFLMGYIYSYLPQL
jgi:hypothetical protein